MNVWAKVIAAGAVGVLAASCGTPQNDRTAQNQQPAAAPPFGPPLATATVILSDSGSGCDKILFGNDSDPAQIDRIHARNGSVIRWTMYNLNCTAPVNVSIAFEGTSPGAPGQPLACSIQGASRLCMIPLTVRPDAASTPQTVFTYHLSINGTQKDPVIIIDP